MTDYQPRIGGRPALPAALARTHRVHLRLTEAEMQSLQETLPAGISLTTHVRDLALATTNPQTK